MYNNTVHVNWLHVTWNKNTWLFVWKGNSNDSLSMRKYHIFESNSIFFFYKSNSTLIVEKFWLAETGREALHIWWNNSACQNDGRHKQAPLHPAKILFLFMLPHHPILANLFIGNHKKTAVLLSNIVITRVSSSFFYIWVIYPSH